MNAKTEMRHYISFIKPRKFNIADIKCFTVCLILQQSKMLDISCAILLWCLLVTGKELLPSATVLLA